MKRMRATKADRKGKLVEHDVPERKVELMKSKGFEVIGGASVDEQAFDLAKGGNWFQVREDIKVVLGVDSLPMRKAEVAELLREKGYNVKE